MSSLKTLPKIARQRSGLSALFLLFCLMLQAGPAEAQAPKFYQSESLDITLPSGIDLSPCSIDLTQKSGLACRRLGKDGQEGVVFLTITKGYAMTGRQALENHLLASEASLQDIPNITVMQALILNDSPLIGLLEILREDDAVLEVTELSKPPLRQSSFLIPLDSELAQVFVYLSTSDENAPALHAKLLAELPKGIRAKQVLRATTHSEQSANVSRPKGNIALLPIALAIGGLLALVVIAGLSISHFRRQKKRDKERADLASQIETHEEILAQDASKQADSERLTQEQGDDAQDDVDASAKEP